MDNSMDIVGRFEQLNIDINNLATTLLQNQSLSKLIYYPDVDPLAHPDIDNSKKKLLDKRLILFKPKIFNVKDTGTYLLIKTYRGQPSIGGQYLSILLCFDIYSHSDVRLIKQGDRPLLIMDNIDREMSKMNIGIGKDNMVEFGELANSDGTFSGYRLVYKDINFRNLKVK